MSWDYGFGTPGNGLIRAAREYPPDFEKMQRLICDGADINAVSADGSAYTSILSAVIAGYPCNAELPDVCLQCREEKCAVCPENIFRERDGRYLPGLCDFFLRNGFDIITFGGECLKMLAMSSYDEYMLDAAGMLLSAGARPGCMDGELAGHIAYKADASICVNCDSRAKKLFADLHLMLFDAADAPGI